MLSACSPKWDCTDWWACKWYTLFAAGDVGGNGGIDGIGQGPTMSLATGNVGGNGALDGSRKEPTLSRSTGIVGGNGSLVGIGKGSSLSLAMIRLVQQPMMRPVKQITQRITIPAMAPATKTVSNQKSCYDCHCLL